MATIGRVLCVASVGLIFGAGWLAGDRLGVPEPVRALTDQLLGQAASASQRAYASSEGYIRSRVDESARFDFDVHLPELPSNIHPDALLIGVRPNGGSADTGTGSLSLVKICPGMSVSNAPPTASDGTVRGLQERVSVGGVLLRSTPVSEGCISSGHGPRGGKIHRGVDFHHPTGSAVMAAADGTVIEAGYRDDYGNYVIIDHGSGVFTRYAHLASFSGGIRAGKSIKDGATIGRMGNSGGWSMPIHLHYEVLTGDYDTPKRAFGLASTDPLAPRS